MIFLNFFFFNFKSFFFRFKFNKIFQLFEIFPIIPKLLNFDLIILKKLQKFDIKNDANVVPSIYFGRWCMMVDLFWVMEGDGGFILDSEGW